MVVDLPFLAIAISPQYQFQLESNSCLPLELPILWIFALWFQWLSVWEALDRWCHTFTKRVTKHSKEAARKRSFTLHSVNLLGVLLMDRRLKSRNSLHSSKISLILTNSMMLMSFSFICPLSFKNKLNRNFRLFNLKIKVHNRYILRILKQINQFSIDVW